MEKSVYEKVQDIRKNVLELERSPMTKLEWELVHKLLYFLNKYNTAVGQTEISTQEVTSESSTETKTSKSK